MRIRRTIIAPVILTIGAIGSLVAVPAAAATPNQEGTADNPGAPNERHPADFAGK